MNVPVGTDLNVAPQLLEVSPGATVAPAIGQVQDFSEAVTYTVTPETGTPQVWTVNVTVSVPEGSGDNAITAFELLGQTDVAIDDTAGTVTVTVPNGTNLSAAPSVLTISPDATVDPARSIVQDFSQPVTYTVTAENEEEKVWTVNVAELPPTSEGSDQNAITAFGLTGQTDVDIDDTAGTVTVTVPNGTELNSAPSVLNISPNATVNPAIGDAQDFSGAVTYTVTAENGDEREWTVNVTELLPVPTESGANDITAFVIAGQNSSSFDSDNSIISVNVPDGTDLNVAPQNLEVSLDATILPAIDVVQDFNTQVVYTVIAENGDEQDWTVNVTVSAPTESDENAITAFELTGQTDVDIDDTTSTITVTVPNGTDLNTAPSVLNVSENATVNPAIGDVQDFSLPVAYTVTAENGDTQEWTVNTTVLPPSGSVANYITAFSLPEQNSSVIDTDNHTVTVNVADGTYLYGQPAELEISQGATIDPLPTAERDFTDPTPYMVTSENGTEQEWIVNVTVSPPTGSGDNAITGFALPVQNSADIDTGNNTITVNVPDGTDLNVAPQNLAISLGATISPAIDVVQDFSGQVVYTVTAENNTTKEWTVNVTVSAPTGSDENAITAFELTGQTDVNIDDTTSTITVTVPNDTDLNTAPSVLNVSENATVNPAIGDVQDFSGAVTYTVTAENTNERVWTVNVSVTENQAPVANVDTIGVELGETVRISVIDNDSDSDNPNSDLVISGVLGVQPENAGSFAVEGQEIVFTSSGSYIGDATFGYTINDGNVGNDASATVTVTIFETEVKVTGVSVSPTTATITEGDKMDLTEVVTPSNASNPAVTWSSSVPRVATVSATGEVTGVSFGSAMITATSDADINISGTSVINVTPINNAPVAVAGPDQTITLPTSAVDLDGSGSSDTAPGNIATYLWTQVNGPATATINATNSESPSVTGLNIAGDYTFRLTVTDDGTPALNDTDDIVVTVGALPNTAPVADAGPDQTITLPTSAVDLDGSGSSDTAPGNIATYLWTQVNGPATATINATNSESPSVTGLNIAGDYTFRLTVTDDGTPALNDTDDIVVTVGALPNTAPVADAGPDQTITLPTSAVDLDGSGSSDTAPGNIATYLWTQVNGPATATINATNSESPSVTGLNIAGDYTFRLTVTDDGTPALNDTDDIVVTVGALPNTAPVADAGPDQTITLPTSAVDLDGSGSSDTAPGNIATYLWTQVNGPATATINATNSESPSVTGLNIAGDYTFRLTVTDDGTPALNDTDDIVVTVGALPNTAPVADAGPDQTITLPTSAVDLDGSGSSDTAPGNIATYLWTQVNGPATATINATNSESPSVTGLNIAGDYTFRLTVTDDGTPALNDTDDIVVTVGALPNTAPVADAGPDQTITLPTSAVDLDGSGSSDTAPGNIATYLWTQVNGPATATINATNSESPSVTGLNIAGDYTFRLTVTDNNEAQSNDLVVVTVNPLEPKAIFSKGSSVSCTVSSVTGTLTITGGSIAFQLSAYGGSGGTSVSAKIDGKSYFVSAPAGELITGDETLPFPPGVYNYTLSGSFSGCSGNGGSIIYK
ncbi:PKD domain-containing protein [Zobellia nedashkovskayae]